MMIDLGFKVRFISRFWGKRAFTVWFPLVKRPTIFVPKARLVNPAWISLTIAHEAIHAQQQRDMGRICFWLSRMTKSGRLRIEAEAYAASVWWYHDQEVEYHPSDDPLRRKATSLSTMYGLDVSVAEAMAEIEKWL